MIPHCKIIVACRSVAAATERLVARLNKGKQVQIVQLPLDEDDFAFDSLHIAYQCYESVAQLLDKILPATELCETEVLVAAPLQLPQVCAGLTRKHGSPDHGWDPLRNYGEGRDQRFQPSLETVVAWWVLTYPEVKWLWWMPELRSAGLPIGEASMLPPSGNPWGEWHGCPVGVLGPSYDARNTQASTSLNGLVRSFPTLFDPSGLRASIRAHMGTAGGANEGHFRVCRTKIVLAVDEERDYSQLEGYAAYRSGHRAWVASSWASFDHLWAWRGTPISELQASFEDLYLAFADQVGALPKKEKFKPDERRLSNLLYRDAPSDATSRNLLSESPNRVLVTVGHKRGRDGGRFWNANLSYLRGRARPFRVVQKPVGSVHTLLKQAVLRRTGRRQAKGSAADSGWITFVRDLQRQEDTRHSAPGWILACADQLLQRAKKILKDCGAPQDALHAAVLALEAKELLSGQTPTTTLEAIALQHEAEVTAESLFLGVEYNKELGERFDEIRREVEAVSYWFGSRRRERSTLNARLTIAERLARRFRDLNQIEEELKCLAEARKLRFAFWVREKPWHWLLWPLLRYLTFSLQSIPRFVTTIVAWGFFFGLSYYTFGALAGRSDLRILDAVVSSWKFTVTAESVTRWTYLVNEDSHSGWEVFWNAWLSFQGAVSLTNFGLLLSHLYLVVSRR